MSSPQRVLELHRADLAVESAGEAAGRLLESAALLEAAVVDADLAKLPGSVLGRRLVPPGSRQERILVLLVAVRRVWRAEGMAGILSRGVAKLRKPNAGSVAHTQGSQDPAAALSAALKVGGQEAPGSVDSVRPIGADIAALSAAFQLADRSLPTHKDYRRRLLSLKKLNKPGPLYEKARTPDQAFSTEAVKLVAFYHMVGEGSWLQLVSALPRFEAHKKPQIPELPELWDGSRPGVLERQVELARRYGVYGFAVCLECHEIVANPVLMGLTAQRFPFCIVVNGTSNLGAFRTALLALEEWLACPAYITRHGQPLVVIDEWPQGADQALRDWKAARGVPEPFVLCGVSSETEDPRDYGLDGALQRFKPCGLPQSWLVHAPDYPGIKLLDEEFGGEVYSYAGLAVSQLTGLKKKPYVIYEAALTGWDDTGLSDSGTVLAYGGPARFRLWIQAVVRRAVEKFPRDERFVFVQSWNDWNNGAVLEPDVNVGHAYLEATRSALELGERLESSLDKPFEPPVTNLHVGELHEPPRNPIFVYQMGKVGSVSVVAGLEKLGLPDPVIHSHALHDLETTARKLSWQLADPRDALNELGRGLAIRRWMETADEQTTWQVITMVREPVGRNISAFFETIGLFVPHIAQRFEVEDFTVEELHQLFLHLYHHEQVNSWFDWQLKPVFNVDVYATPFDKEKGYTIYEQGRSRLLLIRTEDLTARGKQAVKEFLGFQEYENQTLNAAEDKFLSALIQMFKSKPLPDSYLDMMYSGRMAQHFYTAAELQRFRKKWAGK